MSSSLSNSVNDLGNFVNNNQLMNYVLLIVLILYITLVAPKLPKHIAKLFDHQLVKFVYIFLIAYLASKDPVVSLIVTVVILTSIQTLTNYENNGNYTTIFDPLLTTDVSISNTVNSNTKSTTKSNTNTKSNTSYCNASQTSKQNTCGNGGSSGNNSAMNSYGINTVYQNTNITDDGKMKHDLQNIYNRILRDYVKNNKLEDDEYLLFFNENETSDNKELNDLFNYMNIIASELNKKTINDMFMILLKVLEIQILKIMQCNNV